MAALDDLRDCVLQCTAVFRKGLPVEGWQEKGLDVVEIYDMPHESEGGDLEKVDVHFMIVGVDKVRAEERRTAFLTAFVQVFDQKRFKQGPSYIEIGGVLNSQDMAFRMMALGQVLGLWRVSIPDEFAPRDLAAEMAGLGMIYPLGYGDEKECSNAAES